VRQASEPISLLVSASHALHVVLAHVKVVSPASCRRSHRLCLRAAPVLRCPASRRPLISGNGSDQRTMISIVPSAMSRNASSTVEPCDIIRLPVEARSVLRRAAMDLRKVSTNGPIGGPAHL